MISELLAVSACFVCTQQLQVPVLWQEAMYLYIIVLRVVPVQ